MHIKKNKITYFTIFVTIFLLGIFVAISIEAIRYTKYVEPNMVEISPKDAYSEMVLKGKDNYLFLDVRSFPEYQDLHASSSISTPIADLYNKWRNDLPRSGKDIYLICSSGRLAAVAYGYLQIHGFRNIKHISGGISNWINEGQPVMAKDVFKK